MVNKYLSMLIVILLLVGCATDEATSIPPLTETVLPTITPNQPEQITTPSPLTALPAATTTQSASIPNASTSLSPGGPWLLFLGRINGEQYVWAMNADGSHLRSLTDIQVHFLATSSLAPPAYVAETDPEEQIFDLYLLDLPSGQSHHISTLNNPDNISEDQVFLINQAITSTPPVWSPDGQMLAFVGAMNGRSSDVYVYSQDTEQISRLTSGSTQASKLSWSPDSRTILHVGVHQFGSGAGGSLDALWAVRADGSNTLRLDDLNQRVGDEIIFGWLSPDESVVSDWDAKCSYFNLRLINTVTGTTQIIQEDCFWRADFDPESDVVVYTVPEFFEDSELRGVFLSRPGHSASRLANQAGTGFVDWSPEAGLFFFPTPAGLMAVAPTGNIVELPAPAGETNWIQVSPDGRYWAWMAESGLWIGREDEEPRQIMDEEPYSLIWLPDSSGLVFGTKSSLYHFSLLDTEPHLIKKGISTYHQVWNAAWVNP